MQLPDLGNGGAGSLTPQAERKLGERVMRELRRDPDYLDDWLVRDYLNSVSSRLSAAAVTQYLGGYIPDFDLFAGRDPQINAFSMPGGFIGVNTGLIAATQTESELASVVGHEMGHVLQRHIARMISASETSTYAALAGLLFGVLAGVLAHSGDLGSAIAIGGQAYAVDNQLRFSRAAEHEADRVGFQMLSAAGYDPYAMTAFFDRLDRSTMGDNGVPPYARTHPLTGERIADMEDRARRVPYRQPRQSPEYGFVRARSRVLQDRSRSEYADEISRLRSEIDDRTAINVAANWYGIAYGQLLLERYDDAAAQVERSEASRAAFRRHRLRAYRGPARAQFAEPRRARRRHRTARGAQRRSRAARGVRAAALAAVECGNRHAHPHLAHLAAFRRCAGARAVGDACSPGSAGLVAVSRAGKRGQRRCADAASGDGRKVRAGRGVAVGNPATEGRAQSEDDRLLRSRDRRCALARNGEPLQGGAARRRRVSARAALGWPGEMGGRAEAERRARDRVLDVRGRTRHETEAGGNFGAPHRLQRQYSLIVPVEVARHRVVAERRMIGEDLQIVVVQDSDSRLRRVVGKQNPAFFIDKHRAAGS